MDGLLDEILACETAVWDALVAGDQRAEDDALSEGFLGVYPDGFSGKDALVDALANGPTVSAYALSETRVQWLGDDHILLAYRAEYRRSGAAEGEAMYVSSVWQRRGTGWVNVFSQDTPATGEPVP